MKFVINEHAYFGPFPFPLLVGYFCPFPSGKFEVAVATWKMRGIARGSLETFLVIFGPLNLVYPDLFTSIRTDTLWNRLVYTFSSSTIPSFGIPLSLNSISKICSMISSIVVYLVGLST